ncbi:Protein of unknown function [Pyronema omphalodes CBS 100304]|uniref:Uncharacterized protein n=1 Tax=Pyronema omphalodes (strain CBS 100304) TaxID=1076935 RepID=U4LYM1_PYROM|nr:Protein of unknown function [Pyronema omphalodes CBS 100304]
MEMECLLMSGSTDFHFLPDC